LKAFRTGSMSYTYSDFDSRLTITREGSILIKYDRDVIIQSIKTILSTITGERVRSPIGSSLIRMLFQPINDDNIAEIQYRIQSDITRFEPRVEILNLQVSPNYDANRYDIVMNIKIKELGEVIPFATSLKAFV
jgi:phage baseplate assembly protein W